MTILVFSKTTGYRHDSIPAGVAALRELGAGLGVEVEATEDSAVFDPGALTRYRMVVFLNTSGEILDDGGRAALASFVRGGGGFMGVHGAAATEYAWPFYGELVGAWFRDHPAVQPAVIRVVSADHPATSPLPAEWARVDEWYNFRSHPDARVLLTLDESTYDGGGMGPAHPVAWCHERLGGRVFYTALGHTVESYADSLFRAHLGGGIAYVLDQHT